LDVRRRVYIFSYFFIFFKRAPSNARISLLRNFEYLQENFKLLQKTGNSFDPSRCFFESPFFHFLILHIFLNLLFQKTILKELERAPEI